MKLLKDKVALITGGSRGIGRSICKSFAENGCSIAFTYNSSKEAAEDLVEELKKYVSNFLSKILSDEIFIFYISYKVFLNYKLSKTKVMIMEKYI